MLLLRFFFITTLLLLFSFQAGAQQNLRAWYARGQTFLLWEHSGTPPRTYEVYTASQPIRSLRNAAWAERVLSAEAANRRVWDLLPNARWKLPDTVGGTLTVGTNEAYAVLTPLAQDSVYVAVVRTGDTVVTSANTAGPVRQRVESIMPTIQYQDTSVTIYGHWIDGRADYNGGRADFLPMANQWGNGTGHNFAVWEPRGGRPPGRMPLVMGLHGGKGDLMSLRPSVFFYTILTDGLLATFDDGIGVPDMSGDVTYGNTYWVGYWSGLNRFFPLSPPDTAVVVDYTVRRVRWEMKYLLANLPLDTLRISVLGASMGSVGTLFYTQVEPVQASAAIAYVVPFDGPVRLTAELTFGTRSQNLQTSLPGAPRIWNLVNQTWRINQPHADWPPTVIICGKNDTMVGWADKPAVYRQLDSARVGFVLYWDEREHTDWWSGHFKFSARSCASYLTPFKANQSFPAFSATDLDTLTSGRQPDPGNGDPGNGDPWGTWGGYLEWDKASVQDSAALWKIKLWVVTNSPIPCDNSPSSTIRASVTPRRLQAFRRIPGGYYRFQLRDTLGGLRQEGYIYAGSDATVTAPDLILQTYPQWLEITGPYHGVDEETAGVRGQGLGIRMTARPNPFVSFATVPGQEGKRFEMYDVLGRKVGVYTGDRVGGNLGPGVYFLRPEDRSSKPLRVVKVR
jgi:hypothetical protein